MIVQAEDGRAAGPSPGGLEKDGLGRRAVGELPAQVLDVEPVVDKLMLDLGFRATPPV